MNTENMELALAYWRSMAPQPKAIVYANAIEARLKGMETKDMVVDYELTNAIERGSFIAKDRNLKPQAIKVEQKAEDNAPAEKPKAARKSKYKASKPEDAKASQ